MKLAIVVLLFVTLSGMRFDNVTPNSGKEGDAIVMNGANFGSDCELVVGHKVAQILNQSSSQVTFKAPRNSPGKKAVTFTCKDRMPIFERQVFEYTQ